MAVGILGNLSNVYVNFNFLSKDRIGEASTNPNVIYTKDRIGEASVTGSVNLTSGRHFNGPFDSMPSVPQIVKSIHLGGPTAFDGSTAFGRNLQLGVTKSLAEGNPATPSLLLNQYGMWRFRWVIQSGARSISVLCKQANSTQRPSIIVKKNVNIGIPNDIVSVAASSNDWIQIPTISFTATGTDVTWVELWNNSIFYKLPCYFDHIVIS